MLYKDSVIVPRPDPVLLQGHQTNLHNGSPPCITAPAVLLNKQLDLMIRQFTIDQLLLMAARNPLNQPDEGGALSWCRTTALALPQYHCEIVEDGEDGMASFVEILIGPPSNAIALRRSLLAPCAAIGKGSYAFTSSGEIKAWSPMTLHTVDIHDYTMKDAVATIVNSANDANISLLSRSELSHVIADHIAEHIQSSLPSLEGRKEKTLYDVLFQWKD